MVKLVWLKLVKRVGKPGKFYNDHSEFDSFRAQDDLLFACLILSVKKLNNYIMLN